MEGKDLAEESGTAILRREWAANEDQFTSGLDIMKEFIEHCFADLGLSTGCIYTANVGNDTIYR